MRSLKQRKHKKNNSLRQYKKKNNKKKMVGGAPNKVIVDGIKKITDFIENETLNNDSNTNLTNISKYMMQFNKIIVDNTGDKAKKGLFNRTLEEPKIKDYRYILYDFTSNLRKFISNNPYLFILEAKIDVLDKIISEKSEDTNYGLLKDVITWIKNLGLGISDDPNANFESKFRFNQDNDKGIYITPYIDIWKQSIDKFLQILNKQSLFYRHFEDENFIISINNAIDEFKQMNTESTLAKINEKTQKKLEELKEDTQKKLNELKEELIKQKTSQQEIDIQIKERKNQIERQIKNEIVKDVTETPKKLAETKISEYISESENNLFEYAKNRSQNDILKTELDIKNDALKLKTNEYAKNIADAEEVARLKAEEVARLKAEDVALLKAEEVARLKAEEVARLKEEEIARLKEISDAEIDEERKKVSNLETAKNDLEKKQKESNESISQQLSNISTLNFKILEQNDNLIKIQQKLDESTNIGKDCNIEREQLRIITETLRETIANEQSEMNKLKINKTKMEEEQKGIVKNLQDQNKSFEEIYKQQKEQYELLIAEKDKIIAEKDKKIKESTKQKYDSDDIVKNKQIQISKKLGELWNNIKEKCEKGGCDIKKDWGTMGNQEPITTITVLKEQIDKLFLSNETKITELETNKKEIEEKIARVETEKVELETKLKAEKINSQRKIEETITKTKSDKDIEIKGLTESHTTAISKKDEENKQLNQEMTELNDKITSLQTDLFNALLKPPNKIEVSLDKERFYTDICKNIKNIIINAHFLEMLFDKQLGIKSETKGGLKGEKINGEEGLENADKPSSSLSPEETKKIKEMKTKILDARGNLKTFLENFVKQIGLENNTIMSELQNIDQIAKVSIEANMAMYSFATIFFMMGGDKGVNDKSKKKGKTLKSLGLRNKKLTKSQRSMMMKGGLDPENKANLDNLTTKVVTDIYQQMQLNNDLLKYIPDASINTEDFEKSLLVFTIVYKEINGSNTIEPITNFLMPYQDQEIANQDIKELVLEFNKYLDRGK